MPQPERNISMYKQNAMERMSVILSLCLTSPLEAFLFFFFLTERFISLFANNYAAIIFFTLECERERETKTLQRLLWLLLSVCTKGKTTPLETFKRNF